MPGPEQQPNALPPDLADFLRTKERACLTMPTDKGTVLVMKLPSRDLTTIGGVMPIHFRAELYEHPAAPVIRLLTTIYDRPANPLALETFINVAEEDQRQDFEALSRQDQLYLLFYDETLAHRITKAVRGLDHHQLQLVLRKAEDLRAAISVSQFDFDQAKGDVMKRTNL